MDRNRRWFLNAGLSSLIGVPFGVCRWSGSAQAYVLKADSDVIDWTTGWHGIARVYLMGEEVKNVVRAKAGMEGWVERLKTREDGSIIADASGELIRVRQEGVVYVAFERKVGIIEAVRSTPEGLT